MLYHRHIAALGRCALDLIANLLGYQPKPWLEEEWVEVDYEDEGPGLHWGAEDERLATSADVASTAVHLVDQHQPGDDGVALR